MATSAVVSTAMISAPDPVPSPRARSRRRRAIPAVSSRIHRRPAPGLPGDAVRIWNPFCTAIAAAACSTRVFPTPGSPTSSRAPPRAAAPSRKSDSSVSSPPRPTSSPPSSAPDVSAINTLVTVLHAATACGRTSHSTPATQVTCPSRRVLIVLTRRWLHTVASSRSARQVVGPLSAGRCLPVPAALPIPWSASTGQRRPARAHPPLAPRRGGRGSDCSVARTGCASAGSATAPRDTVP